MRNSQSLTHRRVVQLILGMVIYYQVLMNSAWIDMDSNPTWKMVGYALYLVLILSVLLMAWRIPVTRLQMISEIFMGMMMGLFLVLGNLNVGIVFLFAISATLLSISEVIDTYLYSMSLSIFTVFFASLTGGLPITQELTNFWVFGFKNPNVTGYYLFLLFLLIVVKKWQNLNWKIALLGLFVFCMCVYFLEDWTVVLAVLALTVGLAVVNFKPELLYFSFFRWIIVSSPLLFTLISRWIAWAWNHYSFIEQLNRVFTSRPVIWNFYSQNYPVKIIGSALPQQLTFARGAFDGSYMYYPYTNGWLVFVVILFALTAALHKLVRFKRTNLIMLILLLEVVAFSENAPFFAFQSPLLPLALAIGMPGMFSVDTDTPLATTLPLKEV